MKIRWQHLLCTGVLLLSNPLWAQQEGKSELDALREEIRQMRSDYEARIAGLEARLDAAETRENTAVVASSPAKNAYETLPEPSAGTVSLGRDSSFNPAIGVTFQGQAWSYSNDPEDYAIPGFPLGGEAGPAPEGLSLAETEITMSANVDDKFTAMLNLPIVIEDGETVVELEEAWVETLALPANLSLRMGRFYSGIGYLNDRHFHSWDFADQPLVYQAFLGNQYTDDGLRLSWLAPTDFYLEFAGEVFRGDRYPAGGAANSGVGSTMLGVKTGGDIGLSNSWMLGFSWLRADADERESGAEDDPLLFTGDTDLFVADFIWKWAPNGNSRQKNFKFQAEYMWRDETGVYELPDGFRGPWDYDQRGWYAQAVYQPVPRWRVGARYDRLSGAVPAADWQGSSLYPLGDDPTRYSLMVDWSNSEFSRLRLQYNYDDATGLSDNQFGLQYIFSIGAHGAHSF
ncbi:MAG: DNA-binding protein [Xanthomonadales bacterium]|nr:DNA-binding protein [Gammaproteobacteria bacterium]MBT8053371.1 DNA-binding protein [Gammaproteobacteria bacterium]NND55640.1 DNA-binding protein [Xanthomonadales bacterium]NNK50491.1 DNA-binding protein [Xanthomonadales bacterium]